MRGLHWLAGALALLGAALLPARALAQGSPGPYDGVASHSLHIESFDGTRLAITVFQPTAGGKPADEPLPVIVTQNRDGADRALDQMRRFTDSGYVWIAQDRRGTGASFGLQTGFVNHLDVRDAKAVIDWAAEQEFSNGRAVVMGCSNQAAWHYPLAVLRPASLVAIAPACASPMFFDDAVAINGVPMIGLAEQAYAGECREGSTGARPGNMPPPEPKPVDADRDGSLLRAARAEQRCGAPMLGQYWLNMPRDGMNDYAGYQPALGDTATTQWEALRDSGIAVLQIGGWFDAAVPGQIEGQRIFGGHLIMGPWVHGNRPPRGADLPNAGFDLTGETLRFFDLHAKGVTPAAEAPAIRYYTINAAPGEEWRSTEAWPELPRSTLYLRDGGRLSPFAPGGQTSTSLAPGGAKWFGSNYSALARWWTGDFTATNQGSLLYVGEALSADLEITGTVTASLWIAADKPDANVFAMLQDVAPDGSATYITDGRLRASWRAEHDLPWPGATRIWHRGFAADLEPLEPDQPALMRFDFFPISYVVPAGHRLRLTLTGSVGEAYQEPPLAGGEPVTLTLYSGQHHASSISLPAVAR